MATADYATVLEQARQMATKARELTPAERQRLRAELDVLLSAPVEAQPGLDATRADRFNVLNRMRAPFRDTPADEIEQEVARAVEEVRREQQDQTRSSDQS